MRADFQSWVASHQARFEDVLRGLLPRAEVAPQRLHEAMRYAVLDGGKRVRPLLAFAAGELVGAEVARVDIVAAAVELIHAYSLVHDDMPCMDDDVLRRGKPTCHVQYDDATALLVGDSLQALAFQLLAEHRLNGHARFPHPNPLPQAGEGANESLREFHVNETALRRCVHSILGQCLYYRHSHPVLQRLYPKLRYNGEEIDAIACHIADFSLAGIKHIAKEAG